MSYRALGSNYLVFNTQVHMQGDMILWECKHVCVLSITRLSSLCLFSIPGCDNSCNISNEVCVLQAQTCLEKNVNAKKQVQGMTPILIALSIEASQLFFKTLVSMPIMFGWV